jgi:hypothetical protein
MDRIQLIGRNLGRVFNLRTGYVHAVYLPYYQVKLHGLKLKTHGLFGLSYVGNHNPRSNP